MVDDAASEKRTTDSKSITKKEDGAKAEVSLNLVVNIIGAVLFLVMGIALIIGFVLNLSTEEELQQVRTSVISFCSMFVS